MKLGGALANIGRCRNHVQHVVAAQRNHASQGNALVADLLQVLDGLLVGLRTPPVRYSKRGEPAALLADHLVELGSNLDRELLSSNPVGFHPLPFLLLGFREVVEHDVVHRNAKI